VPPDEWWSIQLIQGEITMNITLFVIQQSAVSRH